MKILIKRGCFAGGQHLSAGQTYDLPENIAHPLVTMGRALAAPEDEKTDSSVSTRDPVVESRDPKIAIGKRRK